MSLKIIGSSRVCRQGAVVCPAQRGTRPLPGREVGEYSQSVDRGQ